MRQNLLLIILAYSISITASADDITDAILGVDPRLRLSSGEGAAYGSAYHQQDQTQESEDEDLLQQPRESFKLGDEYYKLRSPLFQDDEKIYENEPKEPYPDDSDEIPLGKPEERKGVYYYDDLRDIPTQSRRLR